MEVVEEIVIVGAGVAGRSSFRASQRLDFCRLGYRSLVLESSDSMRTTGFALLIWTNGWKALDAVGIGDSLRQQHQLIHGTTAISSGHHATETSLKTRGTLGHHEVRCVKRKELLETLGKELPTGTIRYSSKVVSIEESGYFKLVHLADGNILKTKVLIGCDGVNSLVAKSLGFKKPAFAGRSAIRGHADFRVAHGFEAKSMRFFGNGARAGFIPCDDKYVYWFITHTSSSQDEEIEENPAKMKQFVLSKLGKVADKIIAIIENTELDNIISSPLRFRYPWELLWGNISNGNVCIAGDALHPMTPDIGQGGCAALEDGVVLARCLAEAMSNQPSGEIKDKAEEEEEEHEKIKLALEKYAKERRWRSFELISKAYIVGFIQQSGGKMMTFSRERVLATFLPRWARKSADFDCGKLD